MFEHPVVEHLSLSAIRGSQLSIECETRFRLLLDCVIFLLLAEGWTADVYTSMNHSVHVFDNLFKYAFHTMQDWPFPNQVIDEPVNQDGLIWKEYGSVQQQGN